MTTPVPFTHVMRVTGRASYEAPMQDKRNASEDREPRCQCGRRACYAGDSRCEKCFERACIKWNGKDRSVNTLIRNK